MAWDVLSRDVLSYIRSGATLRYACLYSATLSDMHAGFIHSDTGVCKVLLHQARNLVC